MWINERLLLYLPFIPSPPSTSHTAHKFICRMNTVQNPQNSQVKYISHLSLPQNILNSHVLLILIHSQLAPAHITMHKCRSCNLTAVITTLTLITTQNILHVNKGNFPQHKILTPTKHNSN